MADKKKGIVMSVIQEKGGQGKSNSILNIAYFLAQKHKVLIIDLDGQAADITYYLLGNNVGNSKDPKRSDIYTIIDVFNKDFDVNDAIIPVNLFLDVIPANINVTNISSIHKISRFKKVMADLKQDYDFILIDVPPTPNWSHALCLSVCDYVMPIVNPDPASPKAFISLNDSIQEVQETTNFNLEYLGVIANKYDDRTNISKAIIGEIARISETLETSLFETKIHQSVKLNEQTIYHKSIFEYAPNTKAAKEYMSLGNEILDRLKEKGVY